jgi:hypothetical protein
MFELLKTDSRTKAWPGKLHTARGTVDRSNHASSGRHSSCVIFFNRGF